MGKDKTPAAGKTGNGTSDQMIAAMLHAEQYGGGCDDFGGFVIPKRAEIKTGNGAGMRRDPAPAILAK